jgi:hypothetical protein
MKRVFVLAAGVMLALAMGLATLAPADSGNKYPPQSDIRACGDDGDVIVFEGAKTLWPPNHKMQTVTITATEGEDVDPADEVTLTTTATDDEVGLGGAGNPTLDDEVGTGTPEGSNSGTGTTSVDWQLRSERSGLGDGRTYTITASATFDNGTEMCGPETFEVTVPHDQRGGAGWKL